MLDLDKYINLSIEVQLYGKTYHVRQASVKTVMEINSIETAQTKDNYFDSQLRIAKLILDNNTEGYLFSLDELQATPVSVLNLLVSKISDLKKQVESDPN